MGYEAGHGANVMGVSQSLAAGANVLDTVLVTSGRCVLDGILVGGDSTANPALIRVEDVDGNEIQTWSVNLTQAGSYRDGIWCGPHGIRSTNGLRFDVQNDDSTTETIELNFLYRELA